MGARCNLAVWWWPGGDKSRLLRALVVLCSAGALNGATAVLRWL